ncbi:MAG TPA: hypothetical protein VJN18_15335 [Polyangiaceae bacterium]|nr:hypothetical protein [Polyangiaceae bacterium]
MFGKSFIKYVTSMAAALLVGAFASGSSASVSAYEKIASLTVFRHGTNHVVVGMTTNIPAAQRPTCHEDWDWERQYVFDVSTSKGKALLSLLMSAYLAGKSVTVAGTGSCVTVGTYVLETVGEASLY